MGGRVEEWHREKERVGWRVEEREGGLAGREVGREKLA